MWKQEKEEARSNESSTTKDFEREFLSLFLLYFTGNDNGCSPSIHLQNSLCLDVITEEI